MSTIVLNEENAMRSIGEVLCAATDSIIQLTDESGKVIANIVLETDADGADYESVLAELEADVDELRRRRKSSRANDVTTQELLSRVRALTGE